MGLKYGHALTRAGESLVLNLPSAPICWEQTGPAGNWTL